VVTQNVEVNPDSASRLSKLRKWLAGPAPGLAGKRVGLSRGLVLGSLALLAIAFAVGFGARARQDAPKVFRARVAAEYYGRKAEESQKQLEEMRQQIKELKLPKEDQDRGHAGAEASKQVEKLKEELKRERNEVSKKLLELQQVKGELEGQKEAAEKAQRRSWNHVEHIDKLMKEADARRRVEVDVATENYLLKVELATALARLRVVPGLNFAAVQADLDFCMNAAYPEAVNKEVAAGAAVAGVEDRVKELKVMRDRYLAEVTRASLGVAETMREAAKSRRPR
jgi:hypothetical protein